MMRLIVHQSIGRSVNDSTLVHLSTIKLVHFASQPMLDTKFVLSNGVTRAPILHVDVSFAEVTFGSSHPPSLAVLLSYGLIPHVTHDF